ncbi:MAG: hypothetical protein Q9159_000256 [Coniocarpon cinnabarinum]
MDLQSPLTQQSRPEYFKPKVVGLYEEIFHDLFIQATIYVRNGEKPTDENALDTLIVFLENILSKRYPNPSSDSVNVLAGLEDADGILSDFATTLEASIKDGRTLDIRERAVQAVTAAVAGAYQTVLVSYFINEDLFAALMKLVQDAGEPNGVFAPGALLTLLANYNKFEFRNPYQIHIEEYTNEAVLRKAGEGMSSACNSARNAYVDIQDDIPEGWDLNGTLSWVGLGRFTKKGSSAQHPALNEDDLKVALTMQYASFVEMHQLKGGNADTWCRPTSEAAILLSVYDFANANQAFRLCFSSPPSDQPKQAAPVDEFLSFGSYLTQNAYRSYRAVVYSLVWLLITRLLLEDVAAAHCLCNGEMTTKVRLCRQRQPLLPAAASDRTRVAILLDVFVDGINHNLKRHLEVDFYIMILEPMFRAFSYLRRSRARIVYHWSELWKSLIGLLRFLTTYASNIGLLPDAERLADQLVGILALALTTGGSFLIDEKSYNDLFYKIIESGELLVKFRDTYGISKRNAAANMEVLISVLGHYQALLEEKKGRNPKHLGTREINKLIKEGFDSLSLQTREGLDQWSRYREPEYKNLIKKVTRMVVQDMKTLMAERTA